MKIKKFHEKLHDDDDEEDKDFLIWKALKGITKQTAKTIRKVLKDG
jgi:hypothetical protein